MPELPEVETTVREIRAAATGLTIEDVWTDYGSPHHRGKKNIKDRPFFHTFKRAVRGKKIIGTSRHGKHVLIHLSENISILVHMKMSGHFLYGAYRRTATSWVPDDTNEFLRDPYNRHIHLVFTLSNGKHLAFCDLRKFAKITFFKDAERDSVTDLSLIGPEPLHPAFTLTHFVTQLKKRPNGKIKQVLMDQTVIAGIGNIYSDEMLFVAGIHPEERVKSIQYSKYNLLFRAMRKILRHSISIGGDSESDFRNLEGRRGGFQKTHKAYHQTGTRCTRPTCRGTIIRKKVGGRSAHFCSEHQQLRQRSTQTSLKK